MKRIGNVYNQIIDIENLYKAELKARKGKRNKLYVIDFINNLDENIWNLHKELKNKIYCISEYSHFTIYENKERKISKLPYKDRIVHHAILNILESKLTKSFISQTYSCIKGRGIHKCLKDLTKYLRNKEFTKYCLKLDLKKFYFSINHNILKTLIRSKIKDNDLLKVLDNNIESHSGIPLGNYTSQWFANIYLNKFDHWIKQDLRIKYYLRYCDDIVILHYNKQYLHNIRKEIQIYLQNNLKLELSNYQVFPVSKRGIDFVGYKSYHTHILLRKSIKKKWIRMLRKYPNRKSKASYNGWLKYCNSINLKQKYKQNVSNRC